VQTVVLTELIVHKKRINLKLLEVCHTLQLAKTEPCEKER